MRLLFVSSYTPPKRINRASLFLTFTFPFATILAKVCGGIIGIVGVIIGTDPEYPIDWVGGSGGGQACDIIVAVMLMQGVHGTKATRTGTAAATTSPTAMLLMMLMLGLLCSLISDNSVMRRKV